MRAAVLLPAGLVGFRTLRPFLPVADGFQPVSGQPQRHQELLGGAGAAIAQPDVVFGRTALVAMAFHRDHSVGEIGQNGFQSGRVAAKRIARIAADIALVVVEVGVLSLRADALLDRLARRWWGRRRW